MNILFFDTETVGLPKDYKAPITDFEKWPRMVSIAWILTNEEGKELSQNSFIVFPDGFTIPEDATSIHDITTEMAQQFGEPIADIIAEFIRDLEAADMIVNHNISFDRKIVGAEMLRLGHEDLLHGKPRICTMMKSTQFCQIGKEKGNGYKWPKLDELYNKLFDRSFENQHDAIADVRAARDCFFELLSRGVITEQHITEAFNKPESF